MPLSLALICSLCSMSFAHEPARYLFVSAPRDAKVMYVKLPQRGPVTGHGAPNLSPEPLIDSGLKSPMGLAVDQQRNRLLVADPESFKVFSYNLIFTGGKAVVDGAPSVAAQDVEARWVACDGIGNIFVSDERQNKILKVPAEKRLRGEPGAVELYSGQTVTNVNAPGGVAVDNFHVFWSNKATGTSSGSVVKGFESPPGANAQDSVFVVAKNAMKVYGVCLAKDNVYYSDEATKLYGVKKGGVQQTTVSDKLQAPRGCAWDGDGTVFVADRGLNKVFAFAGNMQKIGPARIASVLDVDGAFGVAVMSGASGVPHVAVVAWVLLSALVGGLH